MRIRSEHQTNAQLICTRPPGHKDDPSLIMAKYHRKKQTKTCYTINRTRNSKLLVGSSTIENFGQYTMLTHLSHNWDCQGGSTKSSRLIPRPMRQCTSKRIIAVRLLLWKHSPELPKFALQQGYACCPCTVFQTKKCIDTELQRLNPMPCKPSWIPKPKSV